MNDSSEMNEGALHHLFFVLFICHHLLGVCFLFSMNLDSCYLSKGFFKIWEIIMLWRTAFQYLHWKHQGLKQENENQPTKQNHYNLKLISEDIL